MKRIAGIVLYNPDVERLKENMSTILPQVDELLLIESLDYSESNLEQTKRFVEIRESKYGKIRRLSNDLS